MLEGKMNNTGTRGRSRRNWNDYITEWTNVKDYIDIYYEIVHEVHKSELKRNTGRTCARNCRKDLARKKKTKEEEEECRRNDSLLDPRGCAQSWTKQ